MVRHTRSTPIWSSLLCGASLLTATSAFAQVTISDDRTDAVQTATAGTGGTPSDVTIDPAGSVTLTTPGPAVTLNSDNALINQGEVVITDVDGATGVSLEGGADRSFTHSGLINLSEAFEAANTDEDPFNDTPFASGTGRTGILVSGSSPFEGNITADQTSRILIEGNESYAVDLSNTPLGAGLDGNLDLQGQITLRGDNSSGVRVGEVITGNLTHDGAMTIQGVNSGAFDINADIDGGFASSGSINNNAFRFPTRARFNPDATADRTDLGAEDLGQAASAITVNADIDRGINLYQRTTTTTNSEGNEVTTVASTSNIQHASSTPAILIDGEGTPLAIGTVSAITDTTDLNYNADQLFAFINEGTLSTTGLYNEFDATALSISDATLEGGLRNTGVMQSTTFLGSVARDVAGVEEGTGLSRVIVLGDNAAVERLRNNGTLLARATEAADEVFFDADNVPAARTLVATAIDIGENAELTSLVNEGQLSAALVGRAGTATVVRDASGTLSNITNRGNIFAIASNSDSNNVQTTNFELVALDLSANTSGVTFLQETRADENPDDDVTPANPATIGRIALGTGNDTITSTSGSIIGDIDFGTGNDVLSLTDTTYRGAITGTDNLALTAVNSDISVLSNGPVAIASASFDAGSTFRPLIDGVSGQAATLQATGAISFARGAQISPVFNNIVSVGASSSAFTLASSPNLSVEDLASLNATEDGSFLLDSTYGIDGNALVVTVDLRGTDALGLDASQIGIDQTAFNATLQALQTSPELGNEIANLSTASEFYAAYNQLLPEIGAAARQFVLANSDGATGAVANHLDAARRSPDKPGGAWIQQFAYFADRDLAGLSEQYRGEGFGFSAGLDTALGPFHAVGVNIGFASTEIEDVVGVDEPLDVTSLLAGLYAGYVTGALGIDAYVGGGFNQFEQNRRVRVGNYLGESTGDWDGTHLNASLRAGYDIDFGKRYWARPVVSLDYLRLSEDAYDETGDLGVALSVGQRTSEVGSVSGLLNFGAEFNGARTWIRPSIRIGYRNEFISDPVLTSYSFSGITNAAMAQTVSGDFPNAGLLLGFSIAAGSTFSSVGFDFDSDIRDGFVRHTGRIVVRLLF